MRTELQIAFFLAGGQSHVAKGIGISPQTLNDCIHRRGFSTDRCIQIEEFTKGVINRKLLRPYDCDEVWTSYRPGRPPTNTKADAYGVRKQIATNRNKGFA